MKSRIIDRIEHAKGRETLKPCLGMRWMSTRDFPQDHRGIVEDWCVAGVSGSDAIGLEAVAEGFQCVAGLHG